MLQASNDCGGVVTVDWKRGEATHEQQWCCSAGCPQGVPSEIFIGLCLCWLCGVKIAVSIWVLRPSDAYSDVLQISLAFVAGFYICIAAGLPLRTWSGFLCRVCAWLPGVVS